MRDTEVLCHGRATKILCADWTVDVLIALVLASWYYRNGLGHLSDHLYDTFDQKAMIYLLEWLYRSFFGDGHIAGVFDLNILYPNKNVLAWSDTMLGFLPAYALFRAFTTNPILALNSVAVLATFVGALGMLRLGRELTGRTAVIAGTTGGIGMLVASQEGHFQLKGLCLLVWALLFVVRFIRGSSGAVPWLIVVSSWLFLCSLYYAVMLAVFIVSSSLVAIALGRQRFLSWFHAMLRNAPIGRTAAALGISVIPVVWVALHYLRAKSQFGGYNLETFVTYAARAGSLLDAPPTSLLYRSMYSDWGSHEARLFFGLLVWMGAILLFVGWRGWAMTEVDRKIVALLGFGAGLATVLALGSFERYSLERGVHLPLPAYLYARFFPGFSALRAIGRFGVFASVLMAVLAELGMRNVLDLIGLRGTKAAISYGCIGGLFFLEQTTLLTPQRVDLFPRRQVYQAIRMLTPPDAVVLELPIAKQGHFENVSWWQDQMVSSTLHWRRIPVGFTSQESPTLARLVESYRSLEHGVRTPAQLVDDLLAVGITHVVLNGELMAGDLATKVRTDFTAQGFVATPVTSTTSIYTIRPGATRPSTHFN